MPEVRLGEADIHYETFGEGFPLLLIAPGGMRSRIAAWHHSPADPSQPAPWIDPTADLSDEFLVVAMDQRNAGASRGPVRPGDGWHTYARDQLALADHLGLERFHVMGGCIGGAYALKLYELAPTRVASLVLQNPIGLSEDNRPAFHAMVDDWKAELTRERADVSPQAVDELRDRMFSGEFVFAVGRDLVRSCDVPVLVLPGGDAFHPRAVAEEIASLAPRATVHDPWAGEDHKPRTREVIRAFLREASG